MSRPCRLCRADALAPAFTLNSAPHDVSYLLTPEQAQSDRPIRLDVWRCGECRHVQLAEDPEPTYYDEYLMTVSHSAQMRAYQREQAAAFVQRFGLTGRRVIEVGCGDGNYLSILRDLGVQAIGNEPSARFREAAAEAGHEVLPGYVTAQTPVPDGPYDAFVTRQVFEHVPDPNDFLQGVRASLTDDGVGLVEVPSLEQALEHHRFFDFFPDHVNYWSVATLGRALERNGFLVLEVTRGMNGEYLQALVRVDAGRDLPALAASIDATRDALTGLLERCAAEGRTIAAWGSGAKGLTSLAEVGAPGLKYVIDSDPYKQGRLTPVTHLPVVAPEHLAAEPVDVILLTALAYRDEIVAQLRGPLGFTGTIAILGAPVELLDA
ncbi:MAG TPA: methyltransferase domain-containing protein [Baekduia sp.]|nr:methyltransferase domain-containing protein [Baekduia sp.]